MSDIAVDAGAPVTAPDVSSNDTSPVNVDSSSTANVSSSDQVQTVSSTEQPPTEVRESATAPEGWYQRDGEWYFKAKVYGEEVELPYERAVSMMRQGEAATRAWQEAKRIERQSEEVFASIRDPRTAFDVLSKLGYDPIAFAEAWMADQLEESRLTPEQRELREYRRQLDEYKHREQERQRAEHEQRQAQAERQHREAIVKAFDTELNALNARSNPEARSWIHQRMAQLVQHCEQNGIPSTLKEIARKAHADFERLVGPAPAPAPQPAPTPPKPAPKVTVPPEEQQPQRDYARDPRNGRFASRHDPKPAFDPANPDSVRAIVEWSERNRYKR